MNRTEFQQLAEVRIKEAEALLLAGLWDGAYYLAGYAVECGLKACILARVERSGVIFEDKKFAERCWTHRLDELLVLADLEGARDTEAAANLNFAIFWRQVVKWKEDSRYKHTPQPEAVALCQAISDPTDGVMRWIRSHW